MIAPLNHDAVKHAACPRCHAAAGAACFNASGEKIWTPHAQRVTAFLALPETDFEDYIILVSGANMGFVPLAISEKGH